MVIGFNSVAHFLARRGHWHPDGDQYDADTDGNRYTTGYRHTHEHAAAHCNSDCDEHSSPADADPNTDARPLSRSGTQP